MAKLLKTFRVSEEALVTLDRVASLLGEDGAKASESKTLEFILSIINKHLTDDILIAFMSDFKFPDGRKDGSRWIKK